MSTSSPTSIYYVESLARGLSVLSSFSEERPALSLTDISQRLQLNKTTTYRLLTTLEFLGYLHRDQKTKLYRPALEVLRLGFVVLSGLEVREAAAPYLRQLADKVEETVNLAVLDHHEVIYIDRVGSKHMLNVFRPIGSRLPAYCTSTGKSLLARHMHAHSHRAEGPLIAVNMGSIAESIFGGTGACRSSLFW